jgi:hypothetical protein
VKGREIKKQQREIAKGKGRKMKAEGYSGRDQDRLSEKKEEVERGREILREEE